MDRKKYGNRDGEAILCPLFKEFTASTIRCISHVPDSETVEIRYSSTQRCKRQREIFCEGCWKRCEHYQSWEHWNWSEEE